MRSYLADHPAVGGVNLETYQPLTINQAVLNSLATVSPDTYTNWSAAQRANFYNSLLNQPNSGSGSGSSNGGETYTATSDANGVTLVGSLGDQIVLPNGNGAVEVDDTAGEKDVLTFSAGGTQLQSDSWSTADGTTGTDTYAVDGSSVGKITYVGGSYATILDDGQGNITTDYYNASGILYADRMAVIPP